MADSHTVPGDQACSFDFVYASGGSSQASTSSPTRSTAASATRSATSRSVLNGRCGPCCSMAPSGWTIDAALPQAAGDVRRPEMGEVTVGGHAATLPAGFRWAAWARAGRRRRGRRSRLRPGTDHDVDRRRRRAQRAGDGGVPGPGRVAHARARGPRRSSAARRRPSRSPAPGSTSATATTRRSARRRWRAELDLAEHGLRYVDMDPCGSVDGVVGRAVVAAPPRRRADARRAGRHAPGGGRRLPPLRCAPRPPAVELILAAADRAAVGRRR